MAEKQTPVGVRFTTGSLGYSFGHLVWWTIHQGVYDLAQMRAFAANCGIPQSMIDLLTGASPNAAFEAVTKLRTKTIPSVETRPSCRAQYTTRDISRRERLLVREVIDSTDRELEIYQLGVLVFDGAFKFDPYPDFQAFLPESQQVLEYLSDQYNQMIGQVNDVKLRSVIANWLESRSRVAVRGHGGVYFIPNANDPKLRDEIVKEILAIRRWLGSLTEISDNQPCGVLTSVELFESEALTKDDFLSSAQEEIEEELKEIAEKLEAYRNSPNMNEGSRAEATRTQIHRLTTKVTDKLDALNASLDGCMDLLLSKKDALLISAKRMNKASLAAVSRGEDKGRTWVGK